MNVAIDENWKLQKLKIDGKCRYQKVMKMDENGRNLNWRNTKLMKIDETKWNLKLMKLNLMKINEDWWKLKLMKKVKTAET